MELYIPTRVVIGQGSIREHYRSFAEFGKKALIVTGRQSAVKSGALQDVKDALFACGISWVVFNEVENNPTIETCYRGGQVAKEHGADFIIAIGGGSPMDAAKAIAAYATNDIELMDLYKPLPNLPLPFVSVPLTAGTGSEVTPYSVLTVHEIKNKLTFTHPANFSKIAFLDPDYLKTMTRETLLDTIADALSHAVESLLSRRSTVASAVYAEATLRHLGQCIPDVVAGNPDYERLLLASTLAGMAISHTGTIVVHSMGYMLTYYKDVPHGRANALLLPGYIRLCQEQVPDRLQTVLDAFGAENVEAFCNTIKQLTAVQCNLTPEEAKDFAAKAIVAKNVVQNPWSLTEAEEKSVFDGLVQ
ncbi:MAG: iron-containing alcohol dehydrogenase [Clostridia bacterium]|nr:iron-containing alcohol dehydrogenase [Clostridia bacterium]